MNNRATPTEMCDYKHALLLYKVANEQLPIGDWVRFNFQQQYSSRSSIFRFLKENNYKIGLNSICNRLHSINDKIRYD